MADTRTTEESIAAVLAAADVLALPVTVEYDRRLRTGSATGEVEATIRDDDGAPLAALLPLLHVDESGVATVTDPQAEAMAIILNDTPLLAATLRDERAALARVLASAEGQALSLDRAEDRARLLELVAGAIDDSATGFRAAMREARAQLAAAGIKVDAGAWIRERAAEREPLTVGAALLDPRFKPREVVVEYREVWPPGDDDEEPVLGDVFQLRSAVVDGITYGERRQWYAKGSKWFRWKDTQSGSCGVWSVDELGVPCRLVPIAEADADPATRGPL